MAAQPNHVQDQTQNTPNGLTVSGVQGKAKEFADGTRGAVEQYGGRIAHKTKGLVDSVFPPDKRAAFISQLHAFMLDNPKLSAFLGINLVLTGMPVVLFLLFSFSAFVVALMAALFAAVIFTLSVAGLALLVLLPTVFLTTCAATTLFLWGLGGYYLFKWASRQKNQPSKARPAEPNHNRYTDGMPGSTPKQNWPLTSTRQDPVDERNGSTEKGGQEATATATATGAQGHSVNLQANNLTSEATNATIHARYKGSAVKRVS